MAHDATDLRVRTKKFALQIIKLYQNLSHSGEAQVIGKQILRSGTSVGAQYGKLVGKITQIL
jgi:four helix bundle protein